MSYSVAIIVPVEEVAAINEALAEAGHGPNNLSVPMRGPTITDDVDQATHYGCHWQMGEELKDVVNLVRGVSPTARILAHVPDTEEAEAIGVDTQEEEGAKIFEKQAGNHFYIPVDPDLVEAFTKALYRLINAGKEGRYARIVTNPEPTNWPLLELRQNDVIPIRMQGNIGFLRPVLEAFVEGGGITEAEARELVRTTQEMVGRHMKVIDFIPESWRPHILTRQQVKQLGYEL